MKKILSLFLCLILIFTLSVTFVGCGEKGIVGTFKASFNIGAFLSRSLSDSLEGKMVVDDCEMDFFFSFQESGDFDFYYDEEDLSEACDEAIEDLAEFYEDEAEKIVKSSDKYSSTSDYWKQMGINPKDLATYRVNKNAVIATFEELAHFGTYKYEENKLYVAENAFSLNEKNYYEVNLDGNKLTVTAEIGQRNDNFVTIATLLPLTFKRV